MERANKSPETNRNFDQVISKFSENEKLSTMAMSYVRGGEGEATGGEVVITIPKPPQP